MLPLSEAVAEGELPGTKMMQAALVRRFEQENRAGELSAPPPLFTQ